MRGSDERNGSLFSYVDLEARVPTDHPLRVIRRIADEALAGMSAKFDACYARIGRPSIAPERLMRALLLQAFYSIRSERQLMERLEFDLLFRWFVGLGIDDRVWDASTFSKHRDRLMEADAAVEFLSGVVRYARSQRIRKRIEEVFGWLKTVAGWRKTRFRGLDRTEWGLTLALAAYNLTRMPKLLAEQRA